MIYGMEICLETKSSLHGAYNNALKDSTCFQGSVYWVQYMCIIVFFFCAEQWQAAFTSLTGFLTEENTSCTMSQSNVKNWNLIKHNRTQSMNWIWLSSAFERSQIKLCLIFEPVKPNWVNWTRFKSFHKIVFDCTYSKRGGLIVWLLNLLLNKNHVTMYTVCGLQNTSMC